MELCVTGFPLDFKYLSACLYLQTFEQVESYTSSVAYGEKKKERKREWDSEFNYQEYKHYSV